MSVLDRLTAQILTYWGVGTPDGFGGQTPASPVAIGGFWMEKNDLFIDQNGSEVTSSAVAFVDRDLVIGGWLAEGNQTATADARTLSAAREIRGWAKIPSADLDPEKTVRKAML